MAHAQIPQEELQPLIDSITNALSPIIRVGPSLALIPQEIARLSDNINEDLMSGVPERIEKVAEKFSMDFGGKMLKMQEKYAQKANKAQELKEKLKQKQENRLMAFQSQNIAAEMKGNRVQLLSQKDIEKKQKENLKTQRQIVEAEKKVVALSQAGPGNEGKLEEAINRMSMLQEREQGQSQTLGSKRIDKSETGVSMDDFIGGTPFEDAFMGITEAANNVKGVFTGLAKPIKGAIKLFKNREEIMEKIQKLDVKKYALAVKQFALDGKKLVMDGIQFVLDNAKFIAIGLAITGILGAIGFLGEKIQGVVTSIVDSITGFFGSIVDAFKDSAIGRFFLGDEQETAEERGVSSTGGRNRKSTLATDPKPNVLQNIAPENESDRLARLKGEASQMERDKIVSNIVNAVNNSDNSTSVTTEVKVPKSTSDDALALNPV